MKTLSKTDFEILKAILHKNKELSLTVSGVSMKPLMKSGDKIIVKPIDQALKRFDIIVFYQRDILIVHYFWNKNSYFKGINDEIYITRPLNPMRGYDFPIEKSDILGIVSNFKVTIFQKICILFFRIINN